MKEFTKEQIKHILEETEKIVENTKKESQKDLLKKIRNKLSYPKDREVWATIRKCVEDD